jgi:hypothetical protein
VTMRRRLLVTLLGATILVPAATAANTTIAFTPPATAAFAVTLDGSDQTGAYSLAIPVSYTSNGGNKFATAGWHITATSTTFTGAVTGRTLATTASAITAFDDDAGCTLSNCTDATNTVAYPQAIPAGASAPAAVGVYSAAAASGAGGNTLTMQVGVAVPANTFADTYTSTLTLAIIEGP